MDALILKVLILQNRNQRAWIADSSRELGPPTNVTSGESPVFAVGVARERIAFGMLKNKRAQWSIRAVFSVEAAEIGLSKVNWSRCICCNGRWWGESGGNILYPSVVAN